MFCVLCMFVKRVFLEGRIDVYDFWGELLIVVVCLFLVEGGGEIVWLIYFLMWFLMVCLFVLLCYKVYWFFWVGIGFDVGL